MDFGEAIRALKAGKMVARAGWNGKRMWLKMMDGSFPPEGRDFYHGERPQPDHPERLDGVPLCLFYCNREITNPTMPWIMMRTASGAFVQGWLASQTDMLAEDWAEVEF